MTFHPARQSQTPPASTARGPGHTLVGCPGGRPLPAYPSSYPGLVHLHPQFGRGASLIAGRRDAVATTAATAAAGPQATVAVQGTPVKRRTSDGSACDHCNDKSDSNGISRDEDGVEYYSGSEKKPKREPSSPGLTLTPRTPSPRLSRSPAIRDDGGGSSCTGAAGGPAAADTNSKIRRAAARLKRQADRSLGVYGAFRRRYDADMRDIRAFVGEREMALAWRARWERSRDEGGHRHHHHDVHHQAKHSHGCSSPDNQHHLHHYAGSADGNENIDNDNNTSGQRQPPAGAQHRLLAECLAGIREAYYEECCCEGDGEAGDGVQGAGDVSSSGRRAAYLGVIRATGDYVLHLAREAAGSRAACEELCRELAGLGRLVDPGRGESARHLYQLQV